MPKKKLSFEQALCRLEEIIDEIEDSETPLQKSVGLYKEGVELSVFCGESLNEIEKDVMLLQKTADGVFEQRKFPGGILAKEDIGDEL